MERNAKVAVTLLAIGMTMVPLNKVLANEVDDPSNNPTSPVVDGKGEDSQTPPVVDSGETDNTPVYGEDVYGDNEPTYGEDKDIYGDNEPTYGEDKDIYGDNEPTYGEEETKSVADQWEGSIKGENGAPVVIKGEYKGTETDIVISGEGDGDGAIITNEIKFPENITSLTFGGNGRKVGVAGGSLEDLCKGKGELVKFDGKGLDVIGNETGESGEAGIGGSTGDTKGTDPLFASRSIDRLGDDDMGVIPFTDEDSENVYTSSRVTNMKSMLEDCKKLRLVDLTGWDIGDDVNIENMFKVEGETQPLLVICDNKRFANYDYAGDNRSKIGPVFDANGGEFADGSTTKQPKTTYTLENDGEAVSTFIDSAIDALKNDEPQKEGFVFLGWEEIEEGDAYDKLSATYKAKWGQVDTDIKNEETEDIDENEFDNDNDNDEVDENTDETENENKDESKGNGGSESKGGNWIATGDRKSLGFFIGAMLSSACGIFGIKRKGDK